LHSPCGNPAQLDPSYPYPDGSDGVFGADVKNGLILFPSNHDVMSYCEPYWISDYTYNGIMAYRATAAAPDIVSPRLTNTYTHPPASGSPQFLGDYTGSAVTGTTGSSLSAAPLISTAASGAEPCLILWGRVSSSGLVLEPSFEAVTIPHLPRTTGNYRIKALDAAGAALLDLAFNPETVPDAKDGTRIFAFAVPTRTIQAARLQRLHLSGGGRSVDVGATSGSLVAPATALVSVSAAGSGASEVRWDHTAYPLLVVRDHVTGAILSLARGGVSRVSAPPSALEIRASDRIRTRGSVIQRK
jgi:hypothetical protein